MQDTELRSHLVLQSARLETYEQVRDEIVNVCVARGAISSSAAGGPAPMEVGALGAKGGRG
eukprot:3083167-Lingulodinium_polyedra.AAC.1